MPGVVIAGLPDQIISNIQLKNIAMKFPGGADRSVAKISIDNLSTIPEKPNSYPEYNMFGELPAWGFISAMRVMFNAAVFRFRLQKPISEPPLFGMMCRGWHLKNQRLNSPNVKRY